MKYLYWLLGLMTAVLIGNAAHARAYEPIGINGSGEFLSAKAADRPYLPGMRSIELELLEDALRRKQPISVGDSRSKAQQSIIRNSLRNPIKQSHTLGILAEAVFLEKNPQWGYVSSPTAPQNDVYTWKPGEKRPFTAQIKTHVSGNPAIYAADMQKDYRSPWFIVPDDHVAPLKDYWVQREQIEQRAGRVESAIYARKQQARIQPLGSSYSELSNKLSRAARSAQREQYAGYASIGTSIGLALGPLAWAALQNELTPDQAVLGVAHQGALIGVERSVNYGLTRNSRYLNPGANMSRPRLGGGVIAGSLKGTMITGAAFLAVDTAFAVIANGGFRALHNGGFYTSLGGSISTISLGMLTFSTLGTVNPYLGLLGGATVGVLANLGGRAATIRVLEGLGFDFFYKEDAAALDFEKTQIHSQIVSATSAL